MNTQPHDDDVAWPDDAVEVARVQDAWGIKGWLRVQPHAADPQALFSSRRWPPTPRLLARRPAVPCPRRPQRGSLRPRRRCPACCM